MNYNWKKINAIIALCCCIITVASASIRVVEVTASQQNQATGSITIEVSGTAGPFWVELKDANSNKVLNPAGDFFEEQNYEGMLIFMPLPLGTYFIQVFDANGCMTTLEVIIEEAICDVEVYVADIQHVSECANYPECATSEEQGCTNDGSIKLEILATFNHPFIVEWSGRNYTNTGLEITNLTAGVYEYKVSSANNPSCFVEGEVEINVCKDITIVNAPSNEIICVPAFLYGSLGSTGPRVIPEEIRGSTNGTSNDGQIDISIHSKVPLYQYYWQDDKTPPNRYKDKDLFNLSPGNYCLIMDDGCSETEEHCFEIVDCTEDPLVLKPFISRPCDGTNKGKIYLNVEGGTAPYTFLWSNGSEQQDLEHIPAGAYNVIVSDYYSCQATTQIIVEEEPNNMNVEINVNPFTPYSIAGEIVIKADGPEDYYTLFIDGFEYFPLKSGRAKIFEFESSGTYLIEVYSSTGCGFEEEVFLADCKDDFEDPFCKN